MGYLCRSKRKLLDEPAIVNHDRVLDEECKDYDVKKGKDVMLRPDVEALGKEFENWNGLFPLLLC